MQWLARAELVAAVSNAGALGIMTSSSFPTAKELRAELRKARSLTDKPFGVNINLFPTMRPLNLEEYIDTIIAEGVRIVETAGRSPEPYMERLKKGGVKVMHKVVGTKFARTAERVGCDAVIIDGFECAGHPGEDDVTSLILIPLTADAVKVPVIAAGGFGDGRGLVAALALGAEAILMGTRFMATQECWAHPKVKEWLIKAKETDTLLIQRSLRNTARVLRNTVSDKVVEMENKGATLEQLQPLITGMKEKELMETGNLEAGLLHAGQVVGLIRDIPTIKELVERTVSEAEEIRKLLSARGVFNPWRSV